jgi:hypothetical protein
MEFAELRLQPRVTLHLNNSAFIRVGATVLNWAAITLMRQRPIPHNRRFPYYLSPIKVLAVGAFPNIRVRVVRESNRADSLRSLMRMTREEFEGCCHRRQEDRVVCPQQHRNIYTAHC